MNSVLLFGAEVKTSTNVLNNVSKESKNHNNTSSGKIEAFIMRILFVIVLIAHILIMVDEMDRKTISHSLNRSVSLKKSLLGSEDNKNYVLNNEFVSRDKDNYYKSTEPGEWE